MPTRPRPTTGKLGPLRPEGSDARPRAFDPKRDSRARRAVDRRAGMGTEAVNSAPSQAEAHSSRRPYSVTLTTSEARAFYDSFGAKQDMQAFYEDRALGPLIAHSDFQH